MTFLRSFAAAAAALCLATSVAADEDGAADVISIGGSVTEVIYALDQGHRLLARDRTSTYPTSVTDLPDIGYIRALSAEGVLSVGPKMIIALEGAGPPEAVDVLRASSVDYVEIPHVTSADGVIGKVRAVGDALGVPERADVLANDIEADLKKVMDLVASEDGTPKKVLFVLSRRGGKIMAGGTDTAADAIINLAGGANVANSFQGYKTLTDEAVVAMQPEVILLMAGRGGHSATNEELWSMPSLALTPAAKTNSAVHLDGLLLLGFGPRTPEAIRALYTALYEGS